ncbi:universal stress protein [Thermoactinospora rubra]|uniref:universal stress protein n=1 Tax=Thermoactinospora rubra TaxID=1088767 RepID=UPI000A0F706C|nr:universal stress protein [Thermoactinospora rubra]
MIIVGVDGSAASMRAVEWAAREAALRGQPLKILHAALRWEHHLPLVPQPPRWDAELAVAAQRMLDHAASRAREFCSDVAAEIADGGAADVLLAASRDAAMVAVGSRGRGGFAELLLGSVGRRLVDRASCPVAIVRNQHAPTGEVAVGVTGSADEDAVLTFAFEEAQLRGSTLRAVHAWTHPATRAPGDMQPLVYDVEGIGQEETRLLAERLAGRREKYPDVGLVEDVVHEHPGRALIRASAQADLVVAGTRRGLLGPGTVTHAVTHHAVAPVVAVPY